MRTHSTNSRRMTGLFAPLAALLALSALTGCEIDSWFNPSVQGRWEHMPTTTPILTRIDAIEPPDDYWGQTTEPQPEDLIPSDLTYRMAPGDIVSVGIFELMAPNQWATFTRRIDAGGFLRIQEIGDVQAAGLTPQEFEDALVRILADGYIMNPQVDVAVQEGGGFTFTMDGAVAGVGMYPLRRPDLRLIDAIAQAGGLSTAIKTIYVVRRVELAEEVKPSFRRDRSDSDGQPNRPAQPSSGGNGDDDVDIESLIEELENDGMPSPGFLQDAGEPAIDIDALEPVRTPDEPEVDIEDVGRGEGRGPQRSQWIYIEERGEWVRVSTDVDEPRTTAGSEGDSPFFVERVIEIDADSLRRGESRLNIVVRPNDRIYLKPPSVGNVYIDGQINRPGVYRIPPDGLLTLDRLVAAAGGLGQLAIPEKVDLVRMVGNEREATIRLNLAAIRHRTEPDLVLKPDDHIIIGTDFWATPLAVVRNGFRATYGFGFLLDRNFGNDVFGAPPTNRFGE